MIDLIYIENILILCGTYIRFVQYHFLWIAIFHSLESLKGVLKHLPINKKSLIYYFLCHILGIEKNLIPVNEEPQL